jgi:uncharacterized protein YdeI (YjbR/CyaY-like superfamily)
MPSGLKTMNPRFFKTPADFRAWLEKHHAGTTELWVGFYKKASGRIGISYQEGVDAALCYGWIDGIKKRVDEVSYMHRFTPRRAGSIWSLVNTRRASALIVEGVMAPPGVKTFEARSDKKTGVYTYENERRRLSPALVRRFKANKNAWTFFEAQPPGYRKLTTFWIMSGKKEETQLKRLQIMIDASAKGTRTRWM